MHLSRLGLLVHLVASLPWWHPSTSALPWHGSILGVLMHLVREVGDGGSRHRRLHLDGDR